MNRRARLATRFGSEPSATGGHGDSLVDQHPRERALSRALGIQVVIDRTGWVRSEPEVVIHRDEDGRIYPLTVKMSPETPDDALVGERPVNARFIEYNQLLQTLRGLAQRAASEVARSAAPPDSAIGCAHRELAQLGRVVAVRQARTMGNNSVRLSTLDREIVILQRWDQELAPIIVESETHATMSRPSGSRGRMGRVIDWLTRRPVVR